MAGPCAAIGFRNRNAEKAHLGEALPQFAVIRRLAADNRAHHLGRACLSEKFLRRIPQLLLLVGEIESHGVRPLLSWVPALRRIVTGRCCASPGERCTASGTRPFWL